MQQENVLRALYREYGGEELVSESQLRLAIMVQLHCPSQGFYQQQQLTLMPFTLSEMGKYITSFSSIVYFAKLSLMWVYSCF